jgi:hypothetical protein
MDKGNRKAARASKKASKERLEERWKEVCVAHDAAVAKWQVECTGLREGGTAIKDLPKKPKRVLKRSLVEGEASESDETDESGSDGE